MLCQFVLITAITSKSGSYIIDESLGAYHVAGCTSLHKNIERCYSYVDRRPLKDSVCDINI